MATSSRVEANIEIRGETKLTTGCLKKNATSEFPKKSTLQFLSIKDFRPLGIEIELLIDHITDVVQGV